MATYLRGSEKDKLSHLFVLSIHWFMWFVCMCFAGCQDINNGAFVAKEYYMGVFITFVMSYLNRKVAGSFTLAPTGIKFDTTVDRAFLVSFVIALFNVFNVFVMGGKEWFQVKSEVPNPHCVLDVKFFGSMILATAMSTMVVGNGASDAMKKAFLQNGLIIQAVFLYLTYQIRDSSGNMVYVQYALSLIQAAACYFAQEEL